ncbi:MAG: hypothetical protein OXU42_06430 [Deltaproteobacteria bacterium]|nr:hypothetical protein [Deltaproteobacteria bacterium]
MDKPVESPTFALVPASDPRVQFLEKEHRNFRIFMSRFQDPHGHPIRPTLIIRRTDVAENFRGADVAASFRDVLVACTVPLARSLDIIYDNSRDRVRYGSFFWVYPWMLDRSYERIIAHTPAILALHDVNHLRGQSSPELAPTTLRRRDLDEPLLQELLRRWTARYETISPKWADVALFRSLNMANQACLLPAGADAVMHDYGRIIALWTAACEILAHPGGDGQANLRKVFELLRRIPWVDQKCGHRRYLIRHKKRTDRENLAGWLYWRIYCCRNDFLHGNPVAIENLLTPNSRRALDHHAATLYRLALSSFLRLAWSEPLPASDDADIVAEYVARKMQFQEPQVGCEEALRLCRVSVAQQRRARRKAIERRRRMAFSMNLGQNRTGHARP